MFLHPGRLTPGKLAAWDIGWDVHREMKSRMRITHYGKITFRMRSTLENGVLRPPGLFRSIKDGFDAVASNIGLILFPIGLDLLLWFGTHLRIKSWLLPAIRSSLQMASANNTQELQSLLATIQQTWEVLAERFNLVSFLRSYPLGVPSLLAGIQPTTNPLGIAPGQEIGSSGNSFVLMILFSVAGFVLGAQYFYLVARVSGQEKEKITLMKNLGVIGQILMLNGIFYAVVAIISFPLLMLVSVVFILNPALGQLVSVAMIFILAWLALPLIFAAHGIFMYRQSLRLSLANSIRLSRYAGPQIAMFAVIVLILGTGLNMLWAIPPEDTWLLVIGIAGHAFISTALLAGSFIYYSSLIRWMQEIIQHRMSNAKPVV